MNRHGQSIIEYIFIAILIILGIVIMGPYVLRSVSAHFKLWDESVQDSSTENITQAPASAMPKINTNCTCTADQPGSCGGSENGLQCGSTQKSWSHNCTPLLCDGAPASYCKDDPTCCSTLTNLGCGTTPIGQTPPPNNCNYGYEMQGQTCGSNNTVTCILDSICPPPACLGQVATGSQVCPGTTTGLDQNYGITYVDALTQADCGTTPNCTYCNPALKCQYVLNYCACTYTGSSPACTTITNIASAAAGATIYYGPCEISPINVTQVNTQGNGCTMRYSGCYDFYPNPPCSNSVPANSECCTALGPKNGSGCNLTCNGTDVLDYNEFTPANAGAICTESAANSSAQGLCCAGPVAATAPSCSCPYSQTSGQVITIFDSINDQVAQPCYITCYGPQPGAGIYTPPKSL